MDIVHSLDEPGDGRIGGLLDDFVDAAGLQHAPGFEHDEFRGESHRLVHVVRDEHHRRRFRSHELAETLVDLIAGQRIDSRERLIEQQYFRAQQHRAADADALLLPAGEFVRIAVPEFGIEIHERHEFVDPAVEFQRGPALELAEQADVGVDSKMRKQSRPLHRITDPAAKSRMARVRHGIAEDLDATVIGHEHAVDHLQERRLAAAARADERRDPPRADGEIEVLEDGDVAKALGDVEKLDDLVHNRDTITFRRFTSAASRQAGHPGDGCKEHFDGGETPARRGR